MNCLKHQNLLLSPWRHQWRLQLSLPKILVRSFKALSKRNVRTQVVPKRRCKGELPLSFNEHNNNNMYHFCFSNPEVQVYIHPTFQDAGVQCDLLQFSGHATLTTDASVQCDIECPLFASTPRIDCYSTSESEFSDAPHGADTSTGTYHSSRDIQSSLS